MDKLNKIRIYLGKFLCDIGGFAVIAMVLLVTYSSLSRYLFGIAVNYMEELAGLLLMLVSFLSFAFVFNKGSHIRVELILNSVPRRIKDYLIVFNKLVLILYLLVFTKITYDFVAISYQLDCYTPNANLYEVPWMACMPIGGAIFMISVLISLIEDIVHMIRGEHAEFEQTVIQDESTKTF